MCYLRAPPEYAAQLSALVSVLARDKAHLGVLDLIAPTPDIDSSMYQKHKYELRDRTEDTLQLLATSTVCLAPDVERARLLARHVAGRMQQRLEAAIDGFLVRGTFVFVHDLTEIARQWPPELGPA